MGRATRGLGSGTSTKRRPKNIKIMLQECLKLYKFYEIKGGGQIVIY